MLIEALGEIGPPASAAAPAMIREFVKSPPSRLSYPTTRALVRLGDAGQRALVDLLTDENATVELRTRACREHRTG